MIEESSPGDPIFLKYLLGTTFLGHDGFSPKKMKSKCIKYSHRKYLPLYCHFHLENENNSHRCGESLLYYKILSKGCLKKKKKKRAIKKMDFLFFFVAHPK